MARRGRGANRDRSSNERDVTGPFLWSRWRPSLIVKRAGGAPASPALLNVSLSAASLSNVSLANHDSPEGIAMANKDQSKGKAKTNAPKLTAKQKKEKKAKKAASKGQQ
jgi:hypothetical protein